MRNGCVGFCFSGPIATVSNTGPATAIEPEVRPASRQFDSDPERELATNHLKTNWDEANRPAKVNVRWREAFFLWFTKPTISHSG